MEGTSSVTPVAKTQTWGTLKFPYSYIQVRAEASDSESVFTMED